MNDCADQLGFNLATLPAEARAALNADLIACRIRWECRGLKGQERQRKARELLHAHPADQQTLIAAALQARASR